MSSWDFDNVRLAKLVRANRGDRTLRDVADSVGLSASTLSRIERGERPDLWSLLRLCDWLGLDPREFFKQDLIGLLHEQPDADTQLARLCADVGLDPETTAALGRIFRQLRTEKLSR